MKNILTFEPVRFTSALLALGAAIIALLASAFAWPAATVTLIYGVWNAAVALLNASWTRAKVTPWAAPKGLPFDGPRR